MVIADLAGCQHGVVSRTQLLSAGVDRYAIEHRLARSRLHIVHRGVFAVGHPILTNQGRWMAAVLATGGVLSHRAAAAHHRIWASSYVEVTARSVRRRRGIHAHRALLADDEVTRVDNIPVTTVPRTLFDLASVLRRSQLERAIDEAEVRGLRDVLSLPDLIARYPRRHGTHMVRSVLNDARGVTRSELEARFSSWLDAAGLQRPDRNAYVQVQGYWFECDCVWRRQRVIVELDGRAFHATTNAFERDRDRDRRLQAAGWRVVRVTWKQLRGEPQSLAADLRTLLGR